MNKKNTIMFKELEFMVFSLMYIVLAIELQSIKNYYDLDNEELKSVLESNGEYFIHLLKGMGLK